MNKVSKTFTAASKMGISKKAAANMRIRFVEAGLPPLLESWARTGHEIVFHWIIEGLEEIAALKKRGYARVPKTKNGITDEQIAMAQETDVRTVVDFSRRGKALAWCHEDKRPSLYYGDRTNKAICPVCDKKFNAIDVLMTRDGYSFLEAVRSLT